MYSYSLGTPRSSSFSQSPLKASSKVRNRADFKWWILKLYVFIKHESKLSQWFFLVWNDFGWCWCSMWGFVSEIYYFVLLRLALCFPGAHANGASHSCLSFCNIQTSPPQPQHISLSESFVYAANFQDSNAFNTLIAKYNILSSTIITDLTGKGILSTIPLLIFSWHILYYLLQKVICDYLNRNYLWCHMLECRILFLLIIVKSSGYKFPFQMDFN